MRTTVAAIVVLAMLVMAVGAAGQENRLRRKLQDIVVDHIEFEEVSLPTVIKYLKQRSKELDPEKKGINIFLLPPRDKNKKLPTLTIVVDQIPLGEVIRYVCRGVDYQYRVEKYAVVIAPKERALDQMETRTYPIEADAASALEDKLK